MLFVVLLDKNVPPITALPVIPKPPDTTNDPVDEDDALMEPLPILVNPPNSLIVTVCPAEALIIGNPDISLTEKISPVVRLLSIENNCPEVPSQDKELSVRTVKVIGEADVAPINDIVGFVVIPVNPNDAVAKDNCPVTPKPPLTTNAPVVVLVEAVPEVIANPETFNISVDGLNEIVESLDNADPAEDEDGVNNIGWKTFAFPAELTTIFCEVDPDDAVEVKGTQLITPAAVDCKTELPVAGVVAGRM